MEMRLTNKSYSKFAPTLLIVMHRALDTAVGQLAISSRTPGTKAKMAQRIVRVAAEGITDEKVLIAEAVDEGRKDPAP